MGPPGFGHGQSRAARESVAFHGALAPESPSRGGKSPEGQIRGCAGGDGVLFAPYAATHVPLALVVTQRRQAFWQSFGRWFVRPFRQLPPIA